MKYRTILAAAMAASLLFAAGNRSEACTNVIVTRGASADGSCLVSYAADSHWLYGELYFKPQADWATGSKLKVYDWDSGKYLGEIEQVQHTCKTIGNMNEHQLIIAETTFGGRHGLNNPDAIMDYGSLIYITLQRARTAREAIRLMDELTQKYGYYSEGESFSIADKEEAWIMEMVGKGAEKGSVWVARRIPDGYVSGHANQSRITTFPLDDPDNCLYSKDVISFARKMGWFDGKDEEFSFRDAYCPLDFGGLRGCEARVWSAFNILGKGKFAYEDGGSLVEKDSYDYVDYAMGHNPANNMPLWIKPAGKVSVKDVADVMRDHYEGTPMDMTQDIGAGGNALPYRWRPMGFTYDGKEYTNERAIATQQTAFWFVGQSRGNYPDVLGGIIWFGTDDAATSYVTPIYTNSEIVPECFREGNGDMLTYSSTSSFWLNNRVANACYKMYNYMAPFVREHIDRFENSQISEGVPQTDAKALELYNDIAEKEMKKQSKKNPGYDPMTDTGDAFLQVKQYLTSYSVSTADAIFSAWKKMEETLLVKFIDGNVKAQNEDGTFVHSPESESIPDGLTQPGYTEYWKEAVAHFHGDVVKKVEAE
ncbi:MAG: C69 family dipeptidase [Candidatus Cryptobacteroides sp.]|nr:C69 family dipeptidase [Bacteroidales bacterium]MDY5494651.1 C69 family dipeptidase [Candidatus Cryptobacteroides sp.]